MPDVTLCECFARDGLQNESNFVPTDIKVTLLNGFAAAGFARVEATSYSHPGRVPAFADASAVLRGIERPTAAYFKATCPNPQAVTRALDDKAAGFGADEISFLASASEAHTARNLRTTRQGQWQRIAEMRELAAGQFRIIGVLSMALGCPIEGPIEPDRVIADLEHFLALGITHVSVCDTAGLGTPKSVGALFNRIRRQLPQLVPIAHFHDSRGAGLANCLAALEQDCTWFDTAMGGTGGHPAGISYGQEGHTGNVASEDLVALLEAQGIRTGIDLDAMMALSRQCEAALGRPLLSRVARAGLYQSGEYDAH